MENGENQPWEVAILTFYKKQEAALRQMLQVLTKLSHQRNRFFVPNVQIKLATVDFFQGQEADLVFLSMVQTYRNGFMDVPNRINVAATRARYQFVIVGHHGYFSRQPGSLELKQLSKAAKRILPHQTGESK